MVIHGIDLSRWQAGLTIAQVKADPLGVRFVNISLSRGLAAPANIGENRQIWAKDAKKAGMSLFGYHWLTGAASGAAQWSACRTEAIATFGSLAGWGLSVDCEDDATEAIARDFADAAMRDMGRRPVFYTGDWWLDARSWDPLAPLVPHLWAAPNIGWLPAAPGELSAHWRWTSTGGWRHLSVLQWSASRTITGIPVSSSVVRDPGVICELTGVHLEA